MTTNDLVTGYLDLIGANPAAKQAALIYAAALQSEGETIGRTVVKAFKLGARVMQKTKTQNWRKS